MKPFCLLLAGVCLLLLGACRKDSFITSADARLSITVDTLKYDTLFTSTGSVTQSFKIINENNQKLRLNEVRLMGGTSSNYRMNVDGDAGVAASNIEIAANDSIYVFVQVRVDPASGQLPFIVQDSIRIQYNGNERWVQLEAWGQNAHFLRGHEVSTDETWANDLPYVILDYLYIAPGATLTLDKGCRLYMHADAPMVVDGSLQVNGAADSVDRVYFTGDRLDAPYNRYPAAWPGIFFRATSNNNVLNYAVIRNAYQAIAIEGNNTGSSAQLALRQCIIDNAYDAGILAANARIDAENCLISNCGRNLVLSAGGNYQFTHCTVVSISNTYINHKDPVLLLSDNDGAGNSFNLNALFRNCIFWGEGGLTENEVLTDRKSAAVFSASFDHVLWKVTAVPANVTSNNVINETPQFDSIDAGRHYYNFRLKDSSPALEAGTTTPLTIDLDGKPRPAGLPDLGCYERQ
ncbi:MAG: choice-of-anchor Q domain-containing protein [Chitinophagaceae bacterium]